MPVQFSGKPPSARPCPRCGREIGMFDGRGRMNQARHRTRVPGGKWCREIREAITGKVVTP